MNIADAGAVLAYASAGDNRTVTREAALIWAQALREDMTTEEAQRAIVTHFAESTEYLQPAHVNAIVDRQRKTWASMLPEVIPPRELADFPERGWQWHRVWGDAILAGHSEEAARTIANRQFDIVEDLTPLAIESSDVAKTLDGWRDALLASKPQRPAKGPITRTPARWAADRGLQILDPDGWRNAGKDFRAPCTEAEFDELLPECTVGPFERITEPIPTAAKEEAEAKREPAPVDDVLARHAPELDNAQEMSA